MMSASPLEDHDLATRFTTREQGRSTWQGTESEALARFGSVLRLGATEMDLRADLATAHAEVDRLRAVLAPFESAAEIFDPSGMFVGGEGGECLCSYITGQHLIEAAKARRGECPPTQARA